VETIKLETREGAHVANGEILPYMTPPTVVRWGDRTFLAHDLEAKPPVYREAFVGYVVATVEIA